MTLTAPGRIKVKVTGKAGISILIGGRGCAVVGDEQEPHASFDELTEYVRGTTLQQRRHVSIYANKQGHVYIHNTTLSDITFWESATDT